MALACSRNSNLADEPRRLRRHHPGANSLTHHEDQERNRDERHPHHPDLGVVAGTHHVMSVCGKAWSARQPRAVRAPRTYTKGFSRPVPDPRAKAGRTSIDPGFLGCPISALLPVPPRFSRAELFVTNVPVSSS